MGIVSRYFGAGATLGSMSALVVLVLVWAWMTIHLGPIGFLVGWIPAGLAAFATWLVMTLFWGPLTVLAILIALALLALGGPRRVSETPPVVAPEAEPTAPEVEAPGAPSAPPDALPAAPPTPATPVSPDPASPPPGAAPTGSIEGAPIPATPTSRPTTPTRKGAPRDDLGADAAAAGDTSHSRPQ
jgi:hypothetical protein